VRGQGVLRTHAQNGEYTNKRSDLMVSYVCLVCGYIYDPEIGDPKAGIHPGVEFAALPDDWVCPECGAGKDQFVEVQE
jgi:rubredoxin